MKFVQTDRRDFFGNSISDLIYFFPEIAHLKESQNFTL